MNLNNTPGFPGIQIDISPNELKNLLNKNPKDFAVIYNACSGPIILILTQLLGEESAMDILQDVMLILWNNGHKIRSVEHLNSFLHTTCKNKYIDILRREKRWTKRKIELCRRLKDFQLNMDKYIMESNVLSLLNIQSVLNEEEIKVISYSCDGYTLKEISLMMDKSVSAIYKIKATAKQKIQNYYRNDKDA